MIKLIREFFELWAKQNWLKHIDRAVDKYNRLDRDAKVQAHVVHKLVERYNEIYPGDKIEERRKEQRNGHQKTV